MLKLCTLSSKQLEYFYSHIVVFLCQDLRQMLEVQCRSFSVAAPTLSNSFPDDVKSANTVRTFGRQLMTFLFKLTP